MKMLRRNAYYACAMLALSACDSGLFGSESRLQKPLAGDRISVLAYQTDLREDPILQESSLNLAAASTAKRAENLSVSGFNASQSARAGDGDGWDSSLTPAPIVAAGIVYAMDSQGVISAHNAQDLDQILWRVPTVYGDDLKSLTGGGLAYAKGVLYATTANGSIVALVAADGSLLWRQEAGVPIRSAPAVAENQLYAITIDNQLLTFSARTGQPLWNHRGIKESALYLGSATPAVHNGIVIAAYSSGELFALRADDGMPIWSDSLMTSKRTSAAASLTGIIATPIIRDNVVYAVSNNGLMAASLLSTGRGLWDLELSAAHTPWIAGDYLFVLSTDARLIAVHRANRRIRWIVDVMDWYDTDEPLPGFTSPIMVNSQLLMIDSMGRMLMIDPTNGTLIEEAEVPEAIHARPVVADGAMVLMNKDAELFVLK
jgi:outer membrane protein assembly factor BamB